jgi:hypothetical protein
VAEGNGLLNRHTGNTVSWVRIPPSPPVALGANCPSDGTGREVANNGGVRQTSASSRTHNRLKFSLGASVPERLDSRDLARNFDRTDFESECEPPVPALSKHDLGASSAPERLTRRSAATRPKAPRSFSAQHRHGSDSGRSVAARVRIFPTLPNGPTGRFGRTEARQIVRANVFPADKPPPDRGFWHAQA